MGLPYFIRQFFFETNDAQRELFYLLQVRRTGTGDQLLHSLLFDFDHLVELTEGDRHGIDALVVNGPHLS